MQRIKLFAGSSNPGLAKKIANHLDIELGKADIGTFSDGEVMVEIRESVRGSDCFVVQSTCSPANTHVMELLIMLDALRPTTVTPGRTARCARGFPLPRSSSRT
jgi:ribose-phosphate pyrophosphokinase